MSFSVIAAVFFLLSTSLAIGVAHKLNQLSAGTQQARVTPKYLVMLVLDGARPEYLDFSGLSHLQALRRQGMDYDRAFAGILESETPSGHATLSTGSTPARDGLLGFNWITNTNQPVRLFDPNLVRQGAIEHVMEQANVPTIASLFKQRYPRARVVALSGHKYYAADPLGGPAADAIMYFEGDARGHYVPTAIPGHMPPASVLNDPALNYPGTILPPGMEDTLAVKLALDAFRQMRQQITLINLPEFDWPLGHVDGVDQAKARTLMHAFDRDLGMIESVYRKAGVLDQTLFVITADHGMTPLQHIVPDAVLDDAVTKSGTSSPETTYSTAGYVWLQNAAMEQTVADTIVAARNPYIQSVYYKVVAKSGDGYVRAGGLAIPATADTANQVLLSSFLGGNAPNVVAFCTERTSFETKSAETWKGNHGGGAWESQHVPLLIAGPDMVAQGVSHAPARLEDVAPTVLALMGVKPSGMEGTVLADALLSPTTAEGRSQSDLNRQLTPVVDAMMAESQAELTVK